MSRKEKKAREQKLSTRQLINTKAVGDYSLKTYDGDDLVYFMIRPTNLSVLSDSSVGARVYALMNVLKGVAEIEMLCLSSRRTSRKTKVICGSGRRKSGTRWSGNCWSVTRTSWTALKNP